MRTPIYVTQPVLPPLAEFMPYLEKIWANKILTNGGPFHQELEQALCDYLGIGHISLFANGTLALVTALQALRITGEVITTPYSFVATSHSLLWNGIRPVFVDIDPVTLNLDPCKIEAAITPQTTAIMPVHCYGHPCDVAHIQSIADKHGLKVIYDAAHAFGVKDAGGSVLRHGDLSVLSFHATKVFNTFEGGAIVSSDAQTKERIDHLKNFGFVDELTVIAPGINGKMNEVEAAMGLLQLKHIDAALSARAAIYQQYAQSISLMPSMRLLSPTAGVTWNFAYCPVLIADSHPIGRDALYGLLRASNILARRYFFPLISSLPMYRDLPSAAPLGLETAHRVARQVICLPIYPGLSVDDVDTVLDILRCACSGFDHGATATEVLGRTAS